MQYQQSRLFSKLKVALVYDWVDTANGGAEQVVQTLHNLFPSAPLFTSIYHSTQAVWADKFCVYPSLLDRVPWFRKNHRWSMPLLPLAFESLDLQKYDLIISITSGFAKGIITRADQLHICYLLSPPRFLYDFDQDYVESHSALKLPVISQCAKCVLDYARWWDQAAMFRPDVIVPLSKLVQERVKKIYNLNTSQPIYPPVDAIEEEVDQPAVDKLNLPDHYCLIVSRLVPYKKIDLAIKACSQLKLNLVIVGAGPCQYAWKKLARQLTYPNSHISQPQIIFLSSQPQSVVNALMAQAQMVLSPGVDDFGLTPLQANLFGTPAVINANSGVAEVFQNKVQGFSFKSNTETALKKAIGQTLSQKFNSAKMKSLSREFSSKKFLLALQNLINQHL